MTLSLYFRASQFHFAHCKMSQKTNDSGKGQFVVDLLDEDDDDLDLHSDDEIEISEDQRIMDELIRKERERDEKKKLRRSQTEENTFINSGELEMNYLFESTW